MTMQMRGFGDESTQSELDTIEVTWTILAIPRRSTIRSFTVGETFAIVSREDTIILFVGILIAHTAGDNLLMNVCIQLSNVYFRIVCDFRRCTTTLVTLRNYLRLDQMD